MLADTVGIALQVVLDAVNPAGRLAFVLHDMFAVPFDEIAALVERSPEARSGRIGVFELRGAEKGRARGDDRA